MDVALARVQEFAGSHLAVGRQVQLRPAPATPDAPASRFDCCAVHDASKRAGAGAGAPGGAAAVVAAPGPAAVNADKDNLFRWEVVLEPGPGAVGVTVRFVAGLKRTLESFWQLADGIEGDVRRTNRAWRRRLAQAQGGAATAGAAGE